MAQDFAFLVDAKSCTGCKACEVSCKNRNELSSPGPRLRKVETTEEGTFPVVTVTNVSTSCMHCDGPACVAVCPAGAISKREDGTVVADRSKCIGCQACNAACPWGVPQYREEDGTMVKCDGCVDRRAMGLLPACVHTCFNQALRYGSADEIEALAIELGGERLEGETGPNVWVVR